MRILALKPKGLVLPSIHASLVKAFRALGLNVLDIPVPHDTSEIFRLSQQAHNHFDAGFILDMGIEPFLITATVEGIVAQRLIRKICTGCKTQFEPTEAQLGELQLTPDDVRGKKFFYGRGCKKCNGTGYRGRTGIFEIMVFNDEIRDLIMNQASTNVLRVAAQKAGMKLLRENGLAIIYDGITTIAEIVKSTMLE